MYSAKLTLAELKASPPSEGLVLYDNAIWSWANGDFTGQADDVDVVKADSTALTTGAWTRDVTPVVNVLKFIPRSLWPAIRKGTSNVPVASYVAQAYANSSVGAVYFPRGRYLIETEINTNERKTFGDGYTFTRLVAGTNNMRSVLRLNGQQNLIQDLHIETNGIALAGISCSGSNGASIKRVGVENALRQGNVIEETGNQSEMLIEGCLIRYAGRRNPCGKGTAAAGATTVTISGANPGSLSPRVGYDFVKVGNYPASEITSFTSTSISFFPPLPAAVSAVDILVCQGSGIEIQRNGDNSDIKTKNNTIQDCGLFGIDSSALYGVQSDGDTIEGCGYAAGIGRRVGGGELQTINASFRGVYSENNKDGAAYYHGSSRQLVIDNPVVDQVGNRGLDAVRVVDGNTLRSAVISIEGSVGTRRLEAVNSVSTTLPPGLQAMFVQSAGASNFDVLLQTPAAGNGRDIARLFAMPVVIELADIGGKTCTVRASDGASTTVNGVAGNVGVPVTGNYKMLTAQYGSYGWHVYGR